MSPAEGSPPDAPIRVGVSLCLLGEKVRHDGGHKRDPFLTDLLGDSFEWVGVCPEQEVGMGTPREAVSLSVANGGLRMLGNRSGTDWTGRMTRYARKRTSELAGENLSGFILKKGSPSCGVFRVKVTNPKGMPEWKGTGLFAAEVRRRFPLLPVEEEGRLHDAPLRENFIERVFACHRFRTAFAERFRRATLVEFHTRHKFLLLAHSQKHYRLLGRIVAGMKGRRPSRVLDEYEALFMEALSLRATPRKHVNVLQHILGHLKALLTADEKRELLEVIDDYRNGLVPLIVPITLIRHHVRRHRVPYVADQVYLSPHPKELMLRNHV